MSFFRASSEVSALSSCQKPMMLFIIIMNMIIMKSVHSPIIKVKNEAAKSTYTKTFLNCLRKMLSLLVFSSSIEFLP